MFLVQLGAYTVDGTRKIRIVQKRRVKTIEEKNAPD